MAISDQIIEEIKARLSVAAIVGRRVNLKRAGREMKGLSPFNNEKTPSFFVNEQKQSWFDFSSGKNGDIFSFLMETEGLSFYEALERLAGEAGVELPKNTPEEAEQERKRLGAIEVMEIAAAWFHNRLHDFAGSDAMAYLTKRGIGPDQINDFNIGYGGAGRYDLRDYLAGNGIDADGMIAAGLLIHGDEIKIPYDRFSDRIIFPIHDARGRVVGFGGRAMKADAKAKYVNSPETDLFHKGSMLFNHHRARKPAHDAGEIFVVEGYIDVIAMTAAGYPQTVAPLGTALTDRQIGLLWRVCDEPVICLDGDKAGQKAADRAVEAALPLIKGTKSLRFATMPPGQDPDELFRAHGSAGIRDVLSQTVDIGEMLWRHEVALSPLDTAERRAGFQQRVRDKIKLIKDRGKRWHLGRDMEDRLNRYFNGEDSLRKWKPRPGSTPAAIQASPRLASSPMVNGINREDRREAFILITAIDTPGLMDHWLDELADIGFEGAAATRIMDAVADAAPLGPFDLAKMRETASWRAAEAQLRKVVGDEPLSGTSPPMGFPEASEAIRAAVSIQARSGSRRRELLIAQKALSEDWNDENIEALRIAKSKMEPDAPFDDEGDV